MGKSLTITVDEEAMRSYNRLASLLGGFYKIDQAISKGIIDACKNFEEVENSKTVEEKILESTFPKPAYTTPYPGIDCSCMSFDLNYINCKCEGW